MLEAKRLCLEINREISCNGLAKFTWGNASILYENRVLIKPSGVPFGDIDASMISVVDLPTGDLIDGLKPSVDTDIHRSIYLNDSHTKAVMHTHSTYTTMFAQAKRRIPILGTTHADYFPGDIPVTEQVAPVSNSKSMEMSMGDEVVRTSNRAFPKQVRSRAVLMRSHGVMIWNDQPQKLVELAVVVEEIARLAYGTIMLNSEITIDEVDSALFNFHYQRKHGAGKYYGQ